MADDAQRVLLASDAGYGFVARVEDLQSKNKSGKSVLKLPAGARVLPPLLVGDSTQDLVVAISNEGRMLMFALAELPELPRGKGNKIISIPSARASERQEYLVALCVLGPRDTLLVHAGRRHLSMKPADLEHYRGERGRRGNKLPRGFQNVDRVEVSAQG
jgi:topoisomerase-4 subunit A